MSRSPLLGDKSVHNTRSRWRKRGNKERAPDPEPAEIRAICLEFQKSWSEEERLARRHWYLIRPQRHNKLSSDNEERPLDVIITRPNADDLLAYELPVFPDKQREVRYA